MIFVFGLDDGFVMPTGVAIRSLDRFLSDDDRVLLLHDAVSERHLDDLRSCVTSATLEAVDCSRRTERAWIPPSHVTNAAFFRYLAPELLASDERCVYLDGDVIVRADPRPLFEMSLSGCTVGAVRSRVAPFAASPGGIRSWFELGIPSTAPYFNSGVLVMDLARWRQLRVTERLTEFLDRHGHDTLLADQEALNVAVVNDWHELDRTWNYVTHVTDTFLQQPELEPAEPNIVHFAGRQKPWALGPQPLYGDEWHQLLRQTPWRDFVAHAEPKPTGIQASARRLAGRGVRALRKLAQE